MVATCQRVKPALDQAAAGAESLQIAVATRQKSTARRLVSSCAVLEDTDQMVFTRGAAVTSRFANTGQLSPDLMGNSSRDVLSQDAADRRQHVGLARLSRGALRDR